MLVKKEPINFDKLRTSKIKVFIACYNVIKNKTDYFSNNKINIEILKASAAIPVLYKKRISVGEAEYTDHPYSPFQFIKDLQENLEKKMIIIDMREPSVFFNLMCKMFKKDSYEKQNISEVFLIRPNIDINLLTRNKARIEEAFNQGYLSAFSHKADLKNYLES